MNLIITILILGNILSIIIIFYLLDKHEYKMDIIRASVTRTKVMLTDIERTRSEDGIEKCFRILNDTELCDILDIPEM